MVQAVPARARALREAHRRPTLAGGQGEPSRAADPPELPARDAGPRRRAAVRWLRRAARCGTPLLLRRHRRSLGRGRLPGHGLRQPAGEELAQEALARRPRRARRLCGPPWRPCSTRRRTTSRPAGPSVVPAHLPDRLGRHRRRSRRGAGGRGRGGRRTPCSRSVADVVHALRRARADDEGPLGVRPQGHRSRAVGDRARVRRRAAVHRREPERHAAQDQRDLRPASRSRASASTASSRTCGSRASGSPTCAGIATAART